MTNPPSQPIPSIEFCITGYLMQNESYNQLIHNNYGLTIRERAQQLFDWYSFNEIENWVNSNRPIIEERLTVLQITEIYSILYPIPHAAAVQ